MSSPLKTNRLYPEITESLIMCGNKRKGGEGLVEKENERSGDVVQKKLKVVPDADLVTSLKEAIDKECKMRDAANKLLGLSKNNKQSMEASKGLFVSNMKILELMKELQHLQDSSCLDISKQDSTTVSLMDDVEPCQARIGISDIRIPLEWKEFEQLKGKVDSSTKLGVFCLLRLGSQVLDTQSLVVVDRTMTDISFPDVMIFPRLVDHDFRVQVEVYCSVHTEPHPQVTPTSGSTTSHSGKTSTPIKVLRKIKKDLSKDHLGGTPSRMTPSTSLASLSPYVPRMQNVSPTHNYALAGHTHFTLEDVLGDCHTYNLTVGAVGASGTAVSFTGDQPLLPLWGQICCKIMAEPTCATQPRCTGFINLQQMISGYPAWERLWCVLRQQHLRCWSYPEDVGRKMPLKTINLTKEMSVENAPRLTMRRPNTLLLKDHETDDETFLSFESKEERDQWSTVLRQGIVDLKVWKDSTSYVIQSKANKYYNDNDFDVLPGFSSNARNNSVVHQYTRTAETTVL